MEINKGQLVDFTTMIDLNCSPQRYLFFVELADYSQLSPRELSQLENILSEKLEKKLKVANSYYETKRTLNNIKEAKVILVEKNTFRTAIDILAANKVPDIQIKIPRYARKPELIKLLKESRITVTQ